MEFFHEDEKTEIPMLDMNDTRFIRDYRNDGEVVETYFNESKTKALRIIKLDDEFVIIEHYLKSKLYFPDKVWK